MSLLLALSLAASAADGVYLNYTPPDAYTPVHGVPLPVVVVDQRNADDPEQVGVTRTSVGIPFPLRAASSTPVVAAVGRLVRDCALAAGRNARVGTARDAHGTWLEAQLDTLWLDGWVAYHVDVELTLRLHGAETWEAPLRVYHPGISMLALQRGYTEALDTLGQVCASALR